jgi:drug/metabolite transporter (DMT)-like permease
MDMKRVIGVVVLAIGAVLLGFAYHATNAPMEKISDAMTGRYSNETMWYFAAGIAAVVGGGLLALFGSRK